MPHPLRSALLLPLAALLLLGCKKDEEAPIETTVPLAVGNSWTYKIYRYSSAGVLLDSSRTFVRSVVKDTIIRRTPWFVLSDGGIVRNAKEGYVYYNKTSQDDIIVFSHTRNNIRYGYPYPNYTLWVSSLKNEMLEPVPDSRARYSAYRYDVENQYEYTGVPTPEVQKLEQYVTPGIGMVRENQYYRGLPTALQTRSELMSYRVQ